MSLKNKIFAAIFGVVVAVTGFIGINTQTAQAINATNTTGTVAVSTTAGGLTIEQLEAIVVTLQQQIATIMELLKQRNLAVCGNGTCDTAKGETATSCTADCKQIVGGDCTYKTITGKCTVTDVTDDGTISYTFKPSGSFSINGTHLDSKDKINPYESEAAAIYLGLSCLSGINDPGAEEIENCGLKTSAVFGCKLSVIKTGTCTPISVKFIDKDIVGCAKEGKVIYASWAKKTPTVCCGGLTAINSCTAEGACPNNGSSICANCGNDKCGAGENKYNCPKDCGDPVNNNGKEKCIATGGTWAYSDCASPCVIATKAERLGVQLNCASVCVKDNKCACPNGKFWASREEGCIPKTETACVQEGLEVTTGKSCCAGLTSTSVPVGGCTASGTNSVICSDGIKYVCKKPVATCSKENQSCGQTANGQIVNCCYGYTCAYPTTTQVLGATAGTSITATSQPIQTGLCVKTTTTTCGKEGATCGLEKCVTDGNTEKCYSGSSACCDGYTCMNGKCTAQSTTCGKEGEKFSVVGKQCCAGLVKEVVPTTCSTQSTSGGSVGSSSTSPACLSVATWTCKKPAAQLTCSETCKAKGYISARCNAWSTGTQYADPNAGCKAGEANLGWTSDCTAYGMAGGGRACCCTAATTAETCGKSFGASATTEQKELCAKSGGQILCANTATLCAVSSTGVASNCGTPTTSCYCSCGATGSGSGTTTGVTGDATTGGTSTNSYGGSTSSINLSNLSASLAQAIETAKKILSQLTSSK